MDFIAPAKQPDCPICLDTGYYRQDVPIDHGQFGKVIACECKQLERIALLRELCGMTPMEQTRKLSDIITTDRPSTAEMVNACNAFIEYPYRLLTIWGGSGNAKSIALQSIVNQLIDKQEPAIYITASEMIAHITEAFDRDHSVRSPSAYDRIRQFEQVKFLCIDEFDKVQNQTKFIERTIGEIIDRRYRATESQDGGTVIAMNGDPNILPTHILSRLSQGSALESQNSNLMIHNTDEDIRPYVENPMEGNWR